MTTRYGCPTLLAATAATLLLAACGGGSAGNEPSAGQRDDAKRLAFYACLRKAGAVVRESAGGGADIQVPRSISEARMRTIERDCARKTGGGPRAGRAASKEDQAKFLDQALKFSRCMRAHGVQMSDPKADGRGVRISIKGSSGDPTSPVFRRAQEACGSLNPKGKARRGASGGPGGPSKDGATK